MAIRQTKTSGIDNLMQEIYTQIAKQHEAAVTVTHIEELKRLNDTLQESLVQLKDAKAGMNDAREVCESIYKRLWGILNGIQAALLHHYLDRLLSVSTVRVANALLTIRIITYVALFRQF